MTDITPLIAVPESCHWMDHEWYRSRPGYAGINGDGWGGGHFGWHSTLHGSHPTSVYMHHFCAAAHQAMGYPLGELLEAYGPDEEPRYF